MSKFLKAFGEDVFDNFNADTPDFHPDAEPDLDADASFDLLLQYASFFLLGYR